jgi:hypothetical protein
MHGQESSVTARLRPYGEAHQQFINVGEAWMAFLEFLTARGGADIRTTHRQQEMVAALRYVKSEAFQQQPSGLNIATEWFRAFERRQDVLAALDGFLRFRGLLALQPT